MNNVYCNWCTLKSEGEAQERDAKPFTTGHSGGLSPESSS